MKRRRELNLTQNELAEHTGVDKNTIHHIETGENPGIRALRGADFWDRLAETLACEIPQALIPPAPEENRVGPKIGMRSGSRTPLGRFIVQRRAALGLSHRETALRANITNRCLYLLETSVSETRQPRSKTLVGLAQALQCDIAQLQELISGVVSASPIVEIARTSNPRAEDIERITELSGIAPEDAERKGIQLLRRLLERQQNGYSLFFAKDGDLVELELLL